MEFKGTKGKWEIMTLHTEDDLIGIKVVSDLGMQDVVNFGMGGYIDEEIEYNAKLISCAPEMLEMLDLLTTVYSAENIEKAKLLIIKATTI